MNRSLFGPTVLLPLAFVVLVAALVGPAGARAQTPAWTIVIHGGAGGIRRETLGEEREAAYREALTSALDVGGAILREGGTSLDAVETVIRQMEDDTLFNAGRGAVLTSDGRNELDSSIMDGATRNAGAVAGVHHIAHPITLARYVMERSRHLMMVGNGAEEFALQEGMDLVPAEYFRTEGRVRSLQRAQEREREAAADRTSAVDPLTKYGTVGVVALDTHGNLAAGTSTGGITNKRWGRVGDSPVIGAGTYADNASCAVSATGTGEFFIRAVVAHDICARVQYLGVSVDEAARTVIHEQVAGLGGDGGVIVLDAAGNAAVAFNTDGMFRGMLRPGGAPIVRMYGDEGP